MFNIDPDPDIEESLYNTLHSQNFNCKSDSPKIHRSTATY